MFSDFANQAAAAGLYLQGEATVEHATPWPERAWHTYLISDRRHWKEACIATCAAYESAAPFQNSLP